MTNPPPYAELTDEELEVLRELEATFSHIKGRQIALVAFDLGEQADFGEDDVPFDDPYEDPYEDTEEDTDTQDES